MSRGSRHSQSRMNPGANTQPLRLLKGVAPDAAEADARLLESVRTGDAKAAAAFHDRILPIVNRTIGRLLGNRDPDYDDVTQQSLIELVLTVDRFLGQCPLDAWISIVSARVVYRHLRRRKLERRLFVLEGLESVEHTARGASNQVVLRIAIRRIESHLEAVEP